MANYKINKEELVSIDIYISFDGVKCQVINKETYDNLVEATKLVAEANQNGDMAFDESKLKIQPNDYKPVDTFVHEVAKLLPLDSALSETIQSEASMLSPLSGLYIDPVVTRAAKARYLLKEWTLDIPLKMTTLSNIEQLHKSTIKELGELHPSILPFILDEYDMIVWGT